jgi:4-amino-4-deoxy-L-arabinose transferase-like glycosyltransferase
MNMRRHIYSLTFVGILFYGCLVRAYGLFEPWASGHLGTAGARFGLHALNFVRYGYLLTGFRPISDAGWVAPGTYSLYTAHPPLISILVSLSFRLFGVYEWSARLVPIVFTMAAILLIYQLACCLWSSRAALLSAGFAATMPIGAYYGQHVSDQGALLMFSLSLAMYFYWLYCRRPHTKYLFGIAGTVLFAMLMDWQGFYIIILLACHHLIFGCARWNWRFWLLPLACSLLLLLLIQYIIGLDHFIEKFLHRTGFQASDTDPSQTFTMFQWLWRIGGRTLRAYTMPVLGLGAFWGLHQLVRLIEGKRVTEDTLFVLILLGFATMQLFIGRQAAWIHDYRVEYFTLGLALAAGWTTDYLSESFARKTGWHHLTSLAVTSLLVILAINAASTTVALHRNHKNPTIWADFGRAIAQNTEFDAEVLTSARVSRQLNYYADRKLMGEIWSRTQFEVALSSCTRDCRYFFAPLDFPTYPEDPKASIIPLNVMDSQAYHELLTYLQSRYEAHIGDRYLMFRLDRELSEHMRSMTPYTVM